MNSVVLIGRLTKEPEVKYITGENPIAVASFSIAVDRPSRQGQDKKTDFPRVIAYGNQAENCEKFLAKGLKVAIQGRLQTGSYTNKKGDTVYTTDVIAERVEFIDWKHKNNNAEESDNDTDTDKSDEIPEGFKEMKDEDIPF